MKDTTKYPRVLLIYNSCINKADQQGVSIRGWFADWPKENLAQIYSGGEVGEERFCGHNFKLGQKERRFGKLFFKLKRSAIAQSGFEISLDKNFTKINKLSFWSLFKNKIGKFLLNTGLWELIFKPILSKEMMTFIEKFDPQIIYCQGYSLSFSWLPVMIHEKTNIPICFQTGDDWPSSLYRNSPLAFVFKTIVHQAVTSLLSESTVRLANGKLMAEEYLKRYGKSFEPLMMCDEPARFSRAVPKRVVSKDTISIVYSGRIKGCDEALIDICKSAETLEKEGFKIRVTAFATTIPQEVVNKLCKISNLKIMPGPSHEELPSYLKGADILFLPENFEPVRCKYIRFSISTKAHFYMMSEKPILVYADPVTGIMDYAKEDEWACTVEERNLDKLTQALRELLTKNEYCKKLVDKGLEVIAINHDADKAKARLLFILDKSYKTGDSIYE